ncbi:hypothetical protein C8Q80DRAFT_913915 [Daedaleopsis nitida]|nr:hypothetical protein C8Q80DRAFT_913915 [Daedaleopsis nitida]
MKYRLLKGITRNLAPYPLGAAIGDQTSHDTCFNGKPHGIHVIGDLWSGASGGSCLECSPRSGSDESTSSPSVGPGVTLVLRAPFHATCLTPGRLYATAIGSNAHGMTRGPRNLRSVGASAPSDGIPTACPAQLGFPCTQTLRMMFTCAIVLRPTLSSAILQVNKLFYCSRQISLRLAPIGLVCCTRCLWLRSCLGSGCRSGPFCTDAVLDVVMKADCHGGMVGAGSVPVSAHIFLAGEV